MFVRDSAQTERPPPHGWLLSTPRNPCCRENSFQRNSPGSWQPSAALPWPLQCPGSQAAGRWLGSEEAPQSSGSCHKCWSRLGSKPGKKRTEFSIQFSCIHADGIWRCVNYTSHLKWREPATLCGGFHPFWKQTVSREPNGTVEASLLGRQKGFQSW